ncbi:MAG TPA: FAD-dependent oxidoreductase [Candidatus Rubrimentiphilum sp.]|nr:FAD-dependent oxidoreductase [Candidatus Rubrimentiphilum sp.]
MFSAQELRAIPFLSTLADRELEYLSGVVADIHVLANEYVMHEGDSPALFVVMEGRLDVTKIIDGAERVLGVRTRGDLFGQVSVVLNTPTPASLRASEPSRVIRIEVRDYHSVAAAAPDFAAELAKSAIDRIEGLQEIAAEPPRPELVVIGSQWDLACHDLRNFLQRNHIEFDWLTPEDLRAVEMLERAGADSQLPLVRLRDGKLLACPTHAQIAKALGLSVTPAQTEYDVVIFGAGPAGLAAAVYGASEGLSTVLIEREAPGGQAGTSSRIENYLGFPFGLSGDELASRAFAQAKRLGAEIVVTRVVEGIDAASHMVRLDGGDTLHGRTIILAMGVAWRRLALDSATPLIGRGVYYGAARSEARTIQGKDVHVIGGGNSAGQAALSFSEHARSVTLLVRGDSLEKSMSYYLIEQLKNKKNVQVRLHSEVARVYGELHIEAIDVLDRDTGKTSRCETAALFVMIGADAETAWLPEEIARDENGYVLTGADVLRTGLWHEERDPHLLETTMPGIYAVGDVRAGSVKRVAASVGEGSMAIALVHQYLQREAVAK